MEVPGGVKLKMIQQSWWPMKCLLQSTCRFAGESRVGVSAFTEISNSGGILKPARHAGVSRL